MSVLMLYLLFAFFFPPSPIKCVQIIVILTGKDLPYA